MVAVKLDPNCVQFAPKTVTHVRPMGHHTVYDFKVAGNNHNAVALTYHASCEGGRPASCYGIVVHNCSEAYLKDHESCVISSINLYNFVSPFWDTRNFDWERLSVVVEQGVDFLNRVIDNTEAPLEAINTTTRANRKIGLGVMGLADTLSLGQGSIGWPW